MRGMNNMQGMMKKMKKMQKEMADAQKQLAESEFVGVASQGLVEVTMNGERQVINVSIKPDIIDPDDPEMIEDLVMLAVNDALEKVSAETESKMSKYTKGLNIPGF